MRRKLLRWIGLSLASLGGLLFALLLAMFFLGGGPQSLYQSVNSSTFDAEAWRIGDIWTRGTMVSDLLDREVLGGQNRAEVIALLGPPDHQRPDTFLYTLDIGQRWGSTPWTYALHINFDPKTGRTSSVFYTD